MPASYLGRVDVIGIEADEEGFELHICAYDGEKYVFNIQAVAADLHANVNDTIGEWLAEGEQARVTRHVTDDDHPYEITDPKHPEFGVHQDYQRSDR